MKCLSNLFSGIAIACLAIPLYAMNGKISYRGPLTPGAKLILGKFDKTKVFSLQSNKSFTKPASYFLPHEGKINGYKKKQVKQKFRIKQYFKKTKYAFHHTPRKTHALFKDKRKKKSLATRTFWRASRVRKQKAKIGHHKIQHTSKTNTSYL